jgi:ABC-2 type transport system permease protein
MIAASTAATPVVPVAIGTPVRVSTARQFCWALRRELWESRFLYLGPLGVSAIFLLGFPLHVIHLPQQMRGWAALSDPMERHAAITSSYDIAAGLLMVTGMAVAIFYCLDAVYGERRDRSILFWKSLPVSDLATVLTKASIPLLLLPLFVFAVTVVTQFIMLLISIAVLAGSGQSPALLWHDLSFFRMSFLLLYHLVTIHAFWHAPLYAWLMLVSAWARRAPFLWAFLPPVAACYLEKIAFNTTHLFALFSYRLSGGMEALIVEGTFPMDPMTRMTPLRFLSTPGLWIGFAVTAAFLAAAVRLRRYRGPL